MKDNFDNRHLLKFFSLLTAATLWFYVLNSEPLEVERKVALVLLPPSGMAVNVEVPKVISVKLKGSRAFVKNLYLDNEKVFIELKEYPYEQETFAVTFDKNMIPVPFGVEVLEVKPSQVVLSLDKEIKKYVPVRLKLIGEVAKDFKLVDRKVSPEQFMIRGPHAAIKKIGALHTIPIDLSILEGEGTLNIPLEPFDERVIIESPQDINFDYVIRANKANLSLNNMKIQFLTSQSRFIPSIRSVSVDVLATEDKIKDFNRSEIKIIAEIPEEAKGQLRVQLRAQTPNGVHLLQIRPEYINVQVK